MGTDALPGRAALALCLALLAACATPPPPAPVAPPPAAPPPPVEPGPVLGRDDDFVIVSVRPGETLASLAQRYIGDAGKAWWIAQFNNVTSLRPGQIVVVPLTQRNPLGVHVGGYQTVPVLCYHRFGAKPSKLNVTPAAFEQQMDFLARNGYTVITMPRLARFLEGKEALPAKSVAITIDDGYRSTYEIAYPILKRHGFPATVFLYSDFVGASDAMTWAQMKEMQASGLVSIQPHSKTHANLTLRLPGETDARYRERIRREVNAPVSVLKDRLGVQSFTFAYPYGDVNEYVVDLLHKDSVAQGVTVTAGGNPFYAYPYMLRRSMVFGDQDLEGFKAKLVTFVRTASR
ncbi:MAG: polysaccharide deacetylase family protein [Burkholderiales bacterium]|nr:polysaccharide deacetylase family protein [Burkholderiales bacterium]